MIIDAHAHAWPVWPYEPPVPDAGSRGRAEQLLWEMDRNGVDRAVLVCARIGGNPDNNDYGAAAAAAHPDRLIAFADIDSRWSADYHQPGAAGRLQDAAGRYRLSGFTHYLAPENDGWLVSDDGFAFFATAERLGLIASIAGPPVWQADLRALASAFPRLTILCHHLAGVPSFAGDKRAGLDMVLASAAVPNLWIKASGFYYGAAAPWNYPDYAARAWFEEIYRAFGARRLCWGSDFPVAPMRACTYRQSLEILRTHCGFVTPEDLDWILGRSLDAALKRAGQAWDS